MAAAAAAATETPLAFPSCLRRPPSSPPPPLPLLLMTPPSARRVRPLILRSRCSSCLGSRGWSGAAGRGEEPFFFIFFNFNENLKKKNSLSRSLILSFLFSLLSLPHPLSLLTGPAGSRSGRGGANRSPHPPLRPFPPPLPPLLLFPPPPAPPRLTTTSCPRSSPPSPSGSFRAPAGGTRPRRRSGFMSWARARRSTASFAGCLLRLRGRGARRRER